MKVLSTITKASTKATVTPQASITTTEQAKALMVLMVNHKATVTTQAKVTLYHYVFEQAKLNRPKAEQLSVTYIVNGIMEGEGFSEQAIEKGFHVNYRSWCKFHVTKDEGTGIYAIVSPEQASKNRKDTSTKAKAAQEEKDEQTLKDNGMVAVQGTYYQVAKYGLDMMAVYSTNMAEVNDIVSKASALKSLFSEELKAWHEGRKAEEVMAGETKATISPQAIIDKATRTANSKKMVAGTK